MDWERGADLLNHYRIFPRSFVLFYLGFYAYAWLLVFRWFTAFDWNTLPKDQIVGSVAALAISGFPAIILATMGTILKELLVSYWNGKRPKAASDAI